MEELNTALMALSNAFYEAKTRQNGAATPTPAVGLVETVAEPQEESVVANFYDPEEANADSDDLSLPDDSDSDFRDV